MQSVDAAWEDFINNDHTESEKVSPPIHQDESPINVPKCTDIYISTQTKIGYLNQSIPLNDVFWKIDVIKYQTPCEGVIKKQMKVNCNTKEEVSVLDKQINNVSGIVVIDIISKIDNPNARKVKFKDVRKINVGLSKKDLTSYRTKRKGAFYNCFVLILRIEWEGRYKECHVKIFNTGKLEIPGIQTTAFLYRVLDKVVSILRPYCVKELSYSKEGIDTVLINSNFSCNYYIDRDKLSHILKYKYKIHVVYDPCSYPGIQCKFYYNEDSLEDNGVCLCGEKCSKKGSGKGMNQCLEISFMIFRTGSVLIVGHCDEFVLMKIYHFVKGLLATEYKTIRINGPTSKPKPKKKKIWKRNIIVSV